MARMLKSSFYDTRNPPRCSRPDTRPTCPGDRGAVVDCRVFQVAEAQLEAEVDALIGPDVTREWVSDLPSYETTFDCRRH